MLRRFRIPSMRNIKRPARMSTGGTRIRPRLDRKKIGTHSGTFHCDEALGCFLLKELEEYSDAEIIRSRDPEKLRHCDIILDVGGEYDAEEKLFDHHQKGFMEVFPGFQTKLSSAGLIYKHFGKEIVAQQMQDEDSGDEGNEDVNGSNVKDEDIEARKESRVQSVYMAVYKNFMEAIDAIDNGVNQWDGSQPPKYVNNTHLSARAGRLNPDWDDARALDDSYIDHRFQDAMALTGEEFQASVTWASKVWLPARTIVEDAIRSASSTDDSGEIIKLKKSCPWKEHLYEIEKELELSRPIKYCLYGDKGEAYRVQAVGVPGSFESRLALPAAWRGLRDEQLSEAAQIPGCIFVHASGFIGGNKTYDGALAMARKALALNHSL